MESYRPLSVRLAVLGLGTALILLSGADAEAARKRKAAKTQESATVLVIPFHATEASRVEWLSSGIAAFVAQAGRDGGLNALGPAEALRTLSERGLSADAERLVAEPLVVARELGAQHVVSGQWTAEGLNGIAVQATTFALAEDETVQRVSASGRLDELSSVLSELVLSLMNDEQRKAAAPAIEQRRSTSFTDLAAWMRASADPAAANGALGAVSGQ